MKKSAALVSAACLVLALGAAARAGDPQGPSFGRCSYAATIKKVCALPDTDDYVASLVAGEKLSVTLQAAKGSDFAPRLSLVGPDGVEFVPPSLRATKRGALLSVRSFVVPTTGRWSVRVAGDQGSEGAYTVVFSIAKAPASATKKLTVGDGVDAVVDFQGTDGALLDVKATWKDRSASVTLESIEAPTGGRTTGVAAAAGRTSLSVKGQTLHGGDGTYRLHFAKGGALTALSVAVHVTPQNRPSNRRPATLSDTEPFLDVVDAPVRGAAGVAVLLTGGGFPTDRPPTVLFGAFRATATVMPDGKSLVVLPPAMAGDATVAVSVIGTDGQSCVRDAYFRYVPIPVVSGLFDERGMPARIAGEDGGATLILRGAGFEAGQTVRFGDVVATVDPVTSPTQMRLVAPAGSGVVRVTVEDEFGRAAMSPFEFEYLSAPAITSVEATGGGILDAGHVAAGGGAVVVISGANFSASDLVTVGGVSATVIGSTGDTLTFAVPPGAVGMADVVVTDPASQTAVAESALHIVGWEDATSRRTPGGSDVDALSSLRGAVGDLDGDGVADDLVLVSDASSPGTRREFTRVLFGASGALVDETATRFPAVYSDPAAADEWRAGAVTLGDLDGDGSTDIVIGGVPTPSGDGDEFEARIFANDGAGAFSFDAESPRVRSAAWDIVDADTGETFPLFLPGGANGGRVTAAVVADLDGDDDGEIVVATDHFRTGTLHFPLSAATFVGDDATGFDVASQWSADGTTYDAPALRIFDDRRDQGAGFVDATFTRLPGGDASPGTSPAYHARDVQVGDVNGDGTPDIVVVWDDPTTVTPFGLSNPGADEARVATRVLINDGAGFFTDETSSWMPAAAGDEFWQADRLVLVDLNGDGRNDLVLVHRESTDAYTGAATHGRPALRILRNDGAGTGFTDVTASALPSIPLAGTTDDNLRGTALAVFDFDGDGHPDIVVGTTQSLSDAAGGTARSLRLLHGGEGLAFSDATAFLPAAATDSGEATDVLPADLAVGVRSMLVLADAAPANSVGDERLRAFDWTK